MYTDYYQLQTNPFSNSPDPRFLYMMPHTREALAALEFGITSRRGFMVLTGEAGTGKTTLVRRTLESFDPKRVISSYVFNPRLDYMDFMEFVLADFGVTPTANTKSGLLMQLNRWLIQRFEAGQTCVIFVDEAQGLSKELLEEIRLLTNLETSSHKLLQIVLSGQPELADKLNAPELRQLRQRIALWCRVYTLTAEQTGAYIERRLAAAGAAQAAEHHLEASIFTPNAIQEIYRASKGIPRLINLISEHSLIFGYVEQMKQIPSDLVLDVIQDLDLEQSSPMPSSSTAEINAWTAARPVAENVLPQPSFTPLDFLRRR